jgi:hypothetical protein
MQNSQKIVIGLAILAVGIGAGFYFSRTGAPAPGPKPDSQPLTTAQTTNRPIIHAQRPAVPSETDQETDSNGLRRPSREKVDEYLRKHDRNAASLLTAFHALHDTNFLCEAATNFPNDPRVQRSVLARDLFPEERRKWLDAFKASSPSNSLANYLSAAEYFKNQQSEAGIKEVLTAAGSPQFNQYTMDTILDSESFSQFSGASALETHVSAMSAMADENLHELANFKGVAVGIRDAQQQYLTAGDAASAQNLAQASLSLSDRLMTGDSGKFLINQLVGWATEAIALQSLDQNTSYPFLNGETPAQRLADLKQQKEAAKQFSQNQNAVLSLSEEQQTAYWERMKIYGEIPAMQWLQQQTPATPNTGN